MSYILDALKKRQAEDDPDAAVTLAIMQAQQAELQQHRNRRILWTIAGALMLNAVVLAAWLIWDDDNPAPATASQSPAREALTMQPISQPATPTAQRAREPDRQAFEPPSQTGRVAAAAGTDTPDYGRANTTPREIAPSTRPATAPVRTSPPARAEVLRSVTLDDLSAEERAEVGELEFSSHVFGDLSWVVVNGERLETGDALGPLKLHSITETGVELRFRNYLIDVNVVDGWD